MKITEEKNGQPIKILSLGVDYFGKFQSSISYLNVSLFQSKILQLWKKSWSVLQRMGQFVMHKYE